jgi:hypothetical protein
MNLKIYPNSLSGIEVSRFAHEKTITHILSMATMQIVRRLLAVC